MSERRHRVVVIGPSRPGFLKIRFAPPYSDSAVDVPADRVPPGLRMPNSSFIAVVDAGDVIRLEPTGQARMECENQIRAVLNTEWDPIGVAQAVDDEYDGYIGGILELLKRQATAEAIAQHLESIEVERMELSGSSRDKLLTVAKALRSLHLPDWND